MYFSLYCNGYLINIYLSIIYPVIVAFSLIIKVAHGWNRPKSPPFGNR